MTPRDHLRAAVLAVVLLAHGLVSMPWGPPITAENLAKPKNQEQVDAWMLLVGPIGLSRATFERLLIDVSAWIVEVDDAVTAPIKPVLHALGTGQAWALFAAPDRTPTRLVVDVQGPDGLDRTVLRVLDPELRWRHSQLRWRRVRGCYDNLGEKPTRTYSNLARWIAARAFEDFPDAASVEIKLVSTTSRAFGDTSLRPPPKVEHRKRIRLPKAP